MIKRSPFNANAARFRVNRDRRGYITTGKKSERGFPQSLDHFDLEGFPELRAVYGERPQELVIVLPTNDITDFFDDSFGSWGKKGGEAVLRRHCDGESCVHRIEETVGGVAYGRGEVSACVCEGLPEGDKQRCAYGAILKAYIANPSGGEYISPICYGFRTGSINSGQSIKSELLKMEFLMRQQSGGVARLAGLPMLLSVRMVGGKDDARTKFPIWNLTAMSFNVPALPQPATREPLALGVGEERESESARVPDVEIVDNAITPERPQARPARPWDAETTRAWLVLESSKEKQLANDGDLRAFFAALGCIRVGDIGNSRRVTDEERRKFTSYCFGFESLKDAVEAKRVTVGMCKALYELAVESVEPNPEKPGRNILIPNAWIGEEVVNAIAAYDAIPRDAGIGDGLDLRGEPLPETAPFNGEGEMVGGEI